MAAAAGLVGGDGRVDLKLGLELAIYMSLCWAGPPKFYVTHRKEGVFNIMPVHRTGPRAKIIARARAEFLAGSKNRPMPSPCTLQVGSGRVFFGWVGSGSSGRQPMIRYSASRISLLLCSTLGIDGYVLY